MTVLVMGMMGMGAAALLSGLLLVTERFRSAAGAGRLLALGPVFEATALAMFAAEHFLSARDLMAMVPHWLPGHLFWTYFVGVALLAAAVSFIAWRCVRWSAALLALLFLIIVATLDLPGLQAGFHDRFFWILTVRETCFAAGAMVLAGSVWPRGWVQSVLVRVGRAIVAGTMVFYAIEHFAFPRNVPGLPLEKMTPAWFPAPVVLAYFVGISLLLGGIGLFIRPTVRIAAAISGAILVLLTAFFYVPIFATEMHSPLALEGMNYVGDTLLFAGTVLLAGLGAETATVPERTEAIVAAPPLAST